MTSKELKMQNKDPSFSPPKFATWKLLKTQEMAEKELDLD